MIFFSWIIANVISNFVKTKIFFTNNLNLIIPQKYTHRKGNSPKLLFSFNSFLLHSGQTSGNWNENIFALQCWMHKIPGSDNILAQSLLLNNFWNLILWEHHKFFIASYFLLCMKVKFNVFMIFFYFSRNVYLKLHL